VYVPFSSEKKPITRRTIARAGIAQDRETVRYPGSGTAMQLSPPSFVLSRFAALILSLPSPAGHPRPPQLWPPSLVHFHFTRFALLHLFHSTCASLFSSNVTCGRLTFALLSLFFFLSISGHPFHGRLIGASSRPPTGH